MDRKCKICGGVDKLVDVYQLMGYKLNWDSKRMEYDSIKPPVVYCNACFMTHVWNAHQTPQEAI